MRSATAASSSASLDRTMTTEPRLQLASGRDEALLKVDLSDLVLPKVHDLHVDGLKQSWLSRLFGKH